MTRPTRVEIASHITLYDRIEEGSRTGRFNLRDITPLIGNIKAFDLFRPFFLTLNDALWVETDLGVGYVTRLGSLEDAGIRVVYIEDNRIDDFDSNCPAAPPEWIRVIEGEFFGFEQRVFIEHNGRNLAAEHVAWDTEIRLQRILDLNEFLSRAPEINALLQEIEQKYQGDQT